MLSSHELVGSLRCAVTEHKVRWHCAGEGVKTCRQTVPGCQVCPERLGTELRGGKGARDPVGSSNRGVLLPSLLADSPALCHPEH